MGRLVYFNPISSDNLDGVLSFGGTDLSRFMSDITYAPITSTLPASHYAVFIVQIIKVPRHTGVANIEDTSRQLPMTTNDIQSINQTSV